MSKINIVSEFALNKIQVDKIDFYLSSIIKYNKHTNLVGNSTIENIWDRHVLDCLQLTKHINNKKFKILDLGTGAGLPGVLLSIVGYQRVLMVDSVKKKTDFVRKIIEELSLTAKIQNKRIEKSPISQHDIIVSRALAPLIKLLSYARMYSNKNTTSLFLKGRNANSEINIATKAYFFQFEKIKSLSSDDGCVLKINNIKNKNG
ncbi:16S rRNA (guanine(527)-N(7))-methyltransferase RsmG [Alphaproteobacteria bacterium]|nr:16S rRNA (guanine(527)-N(7))-methyltransferase RsmG [Alphaproteobacteria bacterium]